MVICSGVSLRSEPGLFPVIRNNKGQLPKERPLFKEGYFDSMGFIMLIAFLEEEFGIKTSDEDLIEENFESINAICDFVDRKVKS